jgi:indolepyruvate ferredoxin oxidoreductase beta subunit
MKKGINFLLAGVGGQGTILASDVLANVGLAGKYQVKQAEVHGMSQRGGSVTSFVRWGEEVYSPLVGAGEVDVFLAFEKVEALRNLKQLRPGALTLINLETIKPVTVSSGGQAYPDDDRMRRTIEQVTKNATYLDGSGIGRSLGNPRVSNVVLLGALSRLLENQEMTVPELSAEVWLEVVIQRIPRKYVALNRQAFLLGREAVFSSGS